VGITVDENRSIAPTFVFVAGYIAIWCVFSVAATSAQWGLEQAALLSPMMVSSSTELGATILIAAGIYQLTPFKNACLQHCRAPADFFYEHFRAGLYGAFRMGLLHGAYCLGCCWILMGLLFLGGVMNLMWIALIAIFLLLEKILPLGDLGGRIAGGIMIVIGVLGLFDFLSFTS
jgi:predicted metal-binding membrane protein